MKIKHNTQRKTYYKKGKEFKKIKKITNEHNIVKQN